MKREELAKAIYSTSYLEGEFILRSGIKATEYFDKYLFESNPVILSAIAEEIAKKIPEGTEILAGLETGGIPLATAISLKTGIPTVFVRKEAKTYGTCKMVEGADINGKKVCVVEDVITTGGQVVKSVNAMRELGAVIEDVVFVIERGEKEKPKIAENGLKLNPLFHMSEIMKNKTVKSP
jgi:orotate phosphoribosyltransferase